MQLTDLKTLRLALSLAGLSPTKKLGQHFLVDQSALEQILDAARLNKSDTVLEIGPGVGTLTGELAKRAGRVVAVEKDQRFIEILRRQSPEIELVEGDFLDFDLNTLGRYKVVANLPYYITSKIIQILLNSKNKPMSITILVQKEVAQRITATAGKMSVLSFSVQYFGKPQIFATVPAESFWPVPDVDSAILQIDVYDRPLFKADDKKLFRLVKAGFGERRKMLRNALAGGLAISTDQTRRLLNQVRLADSCRAQELKIEDWQRLYQATSKLGLI